MEEKKTARVSWYIRGHVECPKCEHVSDFMEVDEYWSYCEMGDNKETFNNPCEMTCEECGEEFEVNGSDF
jgi:hypothetical protein